MENPEGISTKHSAKYRVHLPHFSDEREMDHGKLPFEHHGSLQQQDLLVNVTFAVSWYAIRCIHSFGMLPFNFWLNFSEHRKFSLEIITGENTPQSLRSSVFCLYQTQSNQRDNKCVNDKICKSVLFYYVLCYTIVPVSVLWCVVVVFIFPIINMISKQKTCFRPSVSSHKLSQASVFMISYKVHCCSPTHMITFNFFSQPQWEYLQCNWHTSFHSLS